MVDWEQRAITSVRAGSPDVEAIFMAYQAPMRRSAEGKLRSHTGSTLGLSADDVVSAVIVGLCDGAIKLGPDVADRLRPYLRLITRNQAVSLIRRRIASSRAEMKTAARGLHVGERAGTDRERRDVIEPTDVESEVEAIILAEHFESQMHRLTPNERHVIVENVQHARSSTEVAEEIGCEPQNISQLRRTGLRKLRATVAFNAVADDGSGARIKHREES